jgi:hypothetical protein
MQTAERRSMQVTHPRSMGEVGMNIVNRMSTTAPLMHRAPALPFDGASSIAAEFTLAQRFARFGLTALAIVAMSALFGTQLAATLH